MDNDAGNAKHLSRLARGMRDEGVPPDRDLLPEIDAAIDREEARRSVRMDRQAVPWPRLMAVAAALTVMMVAAWSGVHLDEMEPGSSGGPQLAALATGPNGGESEGDGLGVIDQALDELNAALNADPENRNLSSLVLMVHKKRGNLLRRTEGTGMLD